MNKVLVGLLLATLLAGMLASAFSIHAVVTSGTIYIRADGSIDPPDAPISTLDNVAYTLTDNITSDVDGIVVERDNIVVDGAGFTVTETGSGKGITLTDRSNVTIQNTNIQNFSAGIYLDNSNHDSISGNNMINNDVGISLEHSKYNNMSGNNITENHIGIGLELLSDYNSIYGNDITNNNGYGICLDSSSSNSINGNNITNTSRYGIWLRYSSNNSISGNNITNTLDYGLWFDGSLHNSIGGNTITNNSVGIELHTYSNHNSISGNNITNNDVGISLYTSFQNSIDGNTFADSGLDVWDSYSNIVENNTVNDKPLVYLEGVTDYTVGDAGQVVLVRCNRMRVENLNLTRTSIAVQLWATNNSIVSGNNIANNNLAGIWLGSCSNNSIHGNKITNVDGGIELFSSSNNSISGNIITDSSNGIVLFYSDSCYNSMSGNSITNARHRGIWLVGSDYNGIDGNTITNSTIGIVLYGSSNNSICHNNFLDNIVQVNNTTPIHANANANFWDNGSEGNYWSNYNGTDANHDGIGDTPYIIDVNNTDRYPLMVQYVIPEFPSFLILPLFFITTLLAAIVYRRKACADGSARIEELRC